MIELYGINRVARWPDMNMQISIVVILIIGLYGVATCSILWGPPKSPLRIVLYCLPALFLLGCLFIFRALPNGRGYFAFACISLFCFAFAFTPVRSQDQAVDLLTGFCAISSILAGVCVYYMALTYGPNDEIVRELDGLFLGVLVAFISAVYWRKLFIKLGLNQKDIRLLINRDSAAEERSQADKVERRS